MAHAIVRTDKMFGTDNNSGVCSLRYVSDGKTAEIDNGCVVKLDGLEASNGEVSREVYKAVDPAKATALEMVVLVATPEVMYTVEGKRNLENFVNEAGDICRGYYMHTNEVFSVTKEALDAAEDIAIGNVVELQDSNKMKVVASATSGSTTVGKVIDINVVGKHTFYAIQVA